LAAVLRQSPNQLSGAVHDEDAAIVTAPLLAYDGSVLVGVQSGCEPGGDIVIVPPKES